MTQSRDYTDLAVPGVRELQPYTPGKPISELEREYGVSNSIKLASNENPLGVSPKALEAIQGEIDDLWLYPDAGGFRLKQVLAEKHGVDPSCITLGNGSNDVLVFLAQVFLQPGLEAVYSRYCFAVYPIATQMVGATARIAPAHGPDHAMPLGHDLRALYERVGPDTRLVFVANPNNPTGTWLDGERLKDFVGWLPPHVIAVVDEAYVEYNTDDEADTAAAWLAEFPNLVVTRTFSKAYGLAGLRVGYSLSDPGIADLLNRVRPAFNVNSLALAAAEAAVGDSDFIRRSREMNTRGLADLRAAFEAMGLTVIPSAANFLLVGFDRPGAEHWLDEAFLADLVGWYLLAWLGETVRREDPRAGRLLSREHGFDGDDRRALLALVRDLLAGIVPRWRALAESGRVELACNPYAHPMLPLLIDFDSAREARPDTALPEGRYPDGEARARAHLERGRAVHAAFFGAEPAGCWPSEGGLSDAALGLIAEAGFRWTASGQQVLRHSLDDADPGSDALHRPWRLGGDGIPVFFRDDGLADRIGFAYQDWDAGDAVADLVGHLETIADDPEAGAGRVVPIILDGENAWEYYPANGHDFLDGLYRALVEHPRLELRTFGDLAADPHAGVLDHVVAGSWVYGDFALISRRICR